ncbi:MAG: GWxTD domain-containing protein [Cyclobacteriaceae bacterium]|nr:GWxTD domain-containing protein [Cyclobacteriaceae bacterium]UYN87371.1 MAG: GWxTD domain-containing protein [Cyclobacteriaceae bacterium]
MDNVRKNSGIKIMRKFFSIASILLASTASLAQGLQNINYNYIYYPDQEFFLHWKIVHRNNQIEIQYTLERSGEAINLMTYDILWEIRKDLSEKEGTAITTAQPETTSESLKSGRVFLEQSTAGKYAVAKVLNNAKKVMTIFYKKVPASPTPYLSQGNNPSVKNYARLNTEVSLTGFADERPLLVSHYNEAFPAAAPPFSVAQARVSPVLKPDTVFKVAPNASISLSRNGLYLAQQDTTSALGVGFRIEDDYPKLGKLQSLAGPMIYICSNTEYSRLAAAGNDKAQFDKVVLSITGNTDRAKIFMRSYFRRVELANLYFSSYKEGWKTDRGMIYIIFGLPQAVYLFNDREVWEYKNTTFTGKFTFVKAATIFDPENFVLLRDKAYEAKWYEMIDLWRKARF